jgi:hypothetical protein
MCSKKRYKDIQKQWCFIRYIDAVFNKNEVKKVTTFFQSFNDRGDTLTKQNTLNDLNKFANLSLSDTLNTPYYDYYFINDTVRVNNPMANRIYVPKTREKYVSNLYLNGERKYEETIFFKDYRTSTEINVYKEKRKKILGLDYYLVKIIKKQKIIKTTQEKIFSIYLSDNVHIPINHYNIINLSEPTDIKGLIMEIKISSYKGDIVKHFIAQNYDINNFNLKLIEIDALKKM